MPSKAKIFFSAEELQLLQERSFFYRKAAAEEKVMQLLAELGDVGREHPLAGWLQAAFPPGSAAPRIHRGNQLEGLPYRLLDFPAIIQKDQVFLVRTLFWWGHSFSFSLLVQGGILPRVLPLLCSNYEKLRQLPLRLACSNDPWNNRLDSSAYRPLPENASGLPEQAGESGFIRLSLPLELSHYAGLPAGYQHFLDVLLAVLGDQR